MENIEKAFTDIADAIREKGGTSETLYPTEMPDGIRALPSGGGDAKTFVAEYGVTTAQEIIAYLDASKEPFAPMLIKRGNDYYTVTTAAKQADNKIIIRSFATLSGDFYMFTYTVTDGTWASSSHGFQKKLESGANIKTINNESLLGGGNINIPVYDDTALAERVSTNENAIADRYTKDETDGKIAEAMTDVDNEHFHPVTVLPNPADEDPTKRPKANHEYVVIEYEQDGTTIKSETHYLFYGGAYHQKSTGSVSLDGYATEDFVNTKTEKMGEFDVTPIPQGPTGAHEINAILSNKDNEYASLSYVRKSDGALPDTVRMNVRSGIGEDSFELPTKKAVADALSGIAVKLWQASYQLSGEETRQIDLPSNVFAYNLIFSSNSGMCDTYTHFGPGFGARHTVLRNSANNVDMYIYMGANGELRTNTSATGIQLQLQALYFEK